MLQRKLRWLIFLTSIFLLAWNSSYAAHNNFRFALPETYHSYEMYEHSAHLGSILILMPAKVSEPKQSTGYRNLRVLVVNDTPERSGFSNSQQGLRSYAESVLNGLSPDCQQANLSIGSLVQLSGGFAVDWRRQCLSSQSESYYLSEQGRLFISEHGAYGLSQFGFNTNRSATIPESERNWFAKFAFNSNFCQSGTNCGDEGLFKYWVDYQPEETITSE